MYNHTHTHTHKKGSNMEEKIYLIDSYDCDDYIKIVGCIIGTEDDARKFCEEYNSKCESHWDKVWYEEIKKLN